jgi:competence protein ComEC
VALLLFYFSGRWVAKTNGDQRRGFSWRNLAIGFIRSQWVMFIGLLIPLSVLASSVSLVAPLANAIAIPLITFLVVPLLLVSAVLNSAVPTLSDLLLDISAVAMEWLALALQMILDTAGDYASPIVAFSPAVALLVALSCLVLLMPKGLMPRAVGWCGLVVGLTFGYLFPR